MSFPDPLCNFNYPSQEPYFQKLPDAEKANIQRFLNLLRDIAPLQNPPVFNWTTTLLNGKKRYCTSYGLCQFNLPFRIHLIFSKDPFPFPLFTPKDEKTLIDTKQYHRFDGTLILIKTRIAFMNGRWVTVKRPIQPKPEELYAQSVFEVRKIRYCEGQSPQLSITTKLIEPYREGSLKTFLKENPTYLFCELQINAMFSQLLEILNKHPAHNDYELGNIAYITENSLFKLFPINFAYANNPNLFSHDFIPPDDYYNMPKNIDNFFMYQRNVWSMGLILLSILTAGNPAIKDLPHLCNNSGCQDHIPCFFMNTKHTLKSVQTFIDIQEYKVFNFFQAPLLQRLCRLVFAMLKADRENRITPENALLEYSKGPFIFFRTITNSRSIFLEISKRKNIASALLIRQPKISISEINFQGCIIPE